MLSFNIQPCSTGMSRPTMDVGTSGLRAVGGESVGPNRFQQSLHQCVFDWAASTAANAEGKFESIAVPDGEENERPGTESECCSSGSFKTTVPIKYGTTTLMLSLQGQNCGYRQTNNTRFPLCK
jgi:hypothetical protein